MRSRDCAAHAHDSLVPIEKHHVWPQEYHGPTVPANLVQICANAHSDVHYLLSRMLKTGDQVPWTERRTYGPAIRDIAARGYAAILTYGAAQH